MGLKWAEGDRTWKWFESTEVNTTTEHSSCILKTAENKRACCGKWYEIKGNVLWSRNVLPSKEAGYNPIVMYSAASQATRFFCYGCILSTLAVEWHVPWLYTLKHQKGGLSLWQSVYWTAWDTSGAQSFQMNNPDTCIYWTLDFLGGRRECIRDLRLKLLVESQSQISALNWSVLPTLDQPGSMTLFR